MTSIFQISEDVLALEVRIERLEAEEAPDEERVHQLAALLMDKEDLLASKVDSYVSFYRHLEARAKARREEARHLSDLAGFDEHSMTRLKEAVKMVSARLNKPKLEGDTRSITVSTSSRPAVDIVSEQDIPADFKEQVISWKVDKKAITEHVIATGEIPPGVETHPVITVTFR